MSNYAEHDKQFYDPLTGNPNPTGEASYLYAAILDTIALTNNSTVPFQEVYSNGGDISFNNSTSTATLSAGIYQVDLNMWTYGTTDLSYIILEFVDSTNNQLPASPSMRPKTNSGSWSEGNSIGYVINVPATQTVKILCSELDKGTMGAYPGSNLIIKKLNSASSSGPPSPPSPPSPTGQKYNCKDSKCVTDPSRGYTSSSCENQCGSPPKKTNTTLKIILSVGGGVVLIGLVVFIVMLVRRRGGMKSAK